MTEEQITKLLSLSESDISIFNKVSKIFKNTDVYYICKEECIVNWFGRRMLVGEIIMDVEYKEVQDFNKRHWRKLSIPEVIEKFRNKI